LCTEGSAMNEKRERILIDSNVQVDLLWQATKYWFFCLLTISLFSFCWTVLTTANQGSMAVFNALLFNYGPAAAASVIVLPLIYFDLLRVSHRFAGPIFKLRRILQSIAAGEKVESVHFREDDYWHELAADFNAALEKIQEQSAEPSFALTGSASPDDDTVVLDACRADDPPLLTCPPDLIDFPPLLPEGEREKAEAVMVG
jgi:hypothetical protein